MPVLLWIAVLVGGWCAVSVITALMMGTYLRRRHEATDPRGALRPLAVGPMDFWTGLSPDIPDTPESLTEYPDPTFPAPRSGADDRARDPEGVG